MAYEPRITKPKEIVTVVPGVVPGVVGESNIADNAVTSPKIKDSAVRTEDIGAGQVQTEDLSTNAVTGEKIAPDAVTGTKIAAGAVGSEQIKDGSITTPKLVDGAITTPKIGSAQITADKLGPDVTIGTVGVGGITTEKLADGAVTGPKIAANAVSSGKIASGAVGSSELATGAVTNTKIQDAGVTPIKLSAVDSPADGETPTYNQAQAKFEWKTPSAVLTRPIVPPLDTPEIGDGKITPAKLSFTPVSRPLVPPATPAEMEDRFSIAQNLLLFSNLSNASMPNTEIDLAPYVPAGTKYAIVVMTHAGVSSIAHGYDAQFYTRPTDPVTAPLYRLDSGAKDFTNYLTILIPLDTNRKFITSVYRTGVTTACELYLMGYVR